MSNIRLEIPVFTVDAAIKAALYGADRLELCSSFAEGGETPGPGLFGYIRKKVDVPVFVMIRPRGGDFLYSNEELEVMADEIRYFDSMGADGFVFGVLNGDGSVHIEACKKLVEKAGAKPCTFHRAFDVCSDQKKAAEAIIDCGFNRILTSGGKNSVKEGLPQIIRLMEQVKDRIIIMPGGGMKPEFVADFAGTGYLKEIHASCKMFRETKSTFSNADVRLSAGGNATSGVLTVQIQLVEKFKKQSADLIIYRKQI